MIDPPTTRPSLLVRIRDGGDDEAWREFDARYHDLILRYCVRRRLQVTDAEDVRQTVMIQLHRGLPGFRYDPDKGRFRDYLGVCVRNALSEHFRRQNPDDRTLGAPGRTDGPAPGEPEEPAGQGELEAAWEREWVQHHYRLALHEVRRTCDAKSVAVFERLLQGDGIDRIRREFGLEANAIYKIKQRMRDRLRELIARQLTDEQLP